MQGTKGRMSFTPNTLWMGDLQEHMDEAFVRQAFHIMGETVVSVKVIRNKMSGQSSGYCFVEFPDPDAAHSALLRVNGKGVPGSKPHKLFKLNHASSGRSHLLVPEYSLYVGELTKDVDDLSLYRAFASKYKTVRAAKVVTDYGGESKGFGFVRFTSEADQQLALIEMQGNTKLGEKPIRVSLAVAKSRTMVPQPQPHSFQQQQAGTAYSQQYYQQYAPPYYNNPAHQWWQQYQEYYRPAGYPSATTTTATTTTTTTTPTTPTQEPAYSPEIDSKEVYNEEDEILEDPEIEIDVDKANKEYFDKSDELYMALEGSRWHPLDNIYSQIAPEVPNTAK